jgi:hypothetical protein
MNATKLTNPEYIEAALVAHKGKIAYVCFAVSDGAFLKMWGELSTQETDDGEIEYSVFTRLGGSCIIFTLSSIVSIDSFLNKDNELMYDIWIRRPKVLQHQ